MFTIGKVDRVLEMEQDGTDGHSGIDAEKVLEPRKTQHVHDWESGKT